MHSNFSKYIVRFMLFTVSLIQQNKLFNYEEHSNGIYLLALQCMVVGEQPESPDSNTYWSRLHMHI